MTLEGKTLLTIAKWKLDVMPFQGRIDPTVTSVKKKGSPVLLVTVIDVSSFRSLSSGIAPPQPTINNKDKRKSKRRMSIKGLFKSSSSEDVIVTESRSDEDSSREDTSWVYSGASLDDFNKKKKKRSSDRKSSKSQNASSNEEAHSSSPKKERRRSRSLSRSAADLMASVLGKKSNDPEALLQQQLLQQQIQQQQLQQFQQLQQLQQLQQRQQLELQQQEQANQQLNLKQDAIANAKPGAPTTGGDFVIHQDFAVLPTEQEKEFDSWMETQKAEILASIDEPITPTTPSPTTHSNEGDIYKVFKKTQSTASLSPAPTLVTAASVPMPRRSPIADVFKTRHPTDADRQLTDIHTSHPSMRVGNRASSQGSTETKPNWLKPREARPPTMSPRTGAPVGALSKTQEAISKGTISSRRNNNAVQSQPFGQQHQDKSSSVMNCAFFAPDAESESQGDANNSTPADGHEKKPDHHKKKAKHKKKRERPASASATSTTILSFLPLTTTAPPPLAEAPIQAVVSQPPTLISLPDDPEALLGANLEEVLGLVPSSSLIPPTPNDNSIPAVTGTASLLQYPPTSTKSLNVSPSPAPGTPPRTASPPSSNTSSPTAAAGTPSPQGITAVNLERSPSGKSKSLPLTSPRFTVGGSPISSPGSSRPLSESPGFLGVRPTTSVHRPEKPDGATSGDSETDETSTTTKLTNKDTVWSSEEDDSTGPDYQYEEDEESSVEIPLTAPGEKCTPIPTQKEMDPSDMGLKVRINNVVSAEGIDKMKEDYLYKIIVLGNSGVGKTNLLGRWVKGSYQDGMQATIHVEFSTKMWSIEGKLVKVHFWDTAGQERYRAMTRQYYTGSHAAVLMYSVADASTFMAIPEWLSEMRFANPDAHLMLIGNKSDLEYKRQVSTEEAAQFAATNNLLYFETSALDGRNCQASLLRLLEYVYTKAQESSSITPLSPNVSPASPVITLSHNVGEESREEEGNCC